MYRKNSILILVMLMIIATAFSTNTSADNENNSKLLLLKAGQVNTDTITESEKYASQSFNTRSAEETEQYYIVQFTGHVDEKWKQNVTSTGAIIYNYIPHNAFVFRMNEDVKLQVQSLDFVQWVGEYKPSYKYEAELPEKNDIQLSSSDQDNDNTYTVLLFSASDNKRIITEIEDFGGNVLANSGKILQIEIQTDNLSEIASINGISWIEEYIQPTLNNDVAATIVNAATVYETYGLKGNGQIVAVCDTGLDTGVNDNSMHADIRGRILNITDYSDNGPEDDASTMYGGGHGTHVSGSVLGNGTMSDGQYAGTAPEATLVFQAVQDSDGSLGGIDNMADISVFFQDAYELGARIHTNSWGMSTYGAYTIESQQVDQFMWDHPDMLILFSAGNEGRDTDNNGVINTDSIGAPGTAKNCLTVGASENYRPEITTIYGAYFSSNDVIKYDYRADNDEGIAAFSSRGPTDDGRIKPDLVAPGTYINSTKSSLTSGTGDYLYMSGTSMATPITAGSAAIVRQYYTDVKNLSSPSAALIKATLINGAYNLTPGQYGNGSTQEINGRPDYAQGWGRVDIENAIYPQYQGIIKYFDNMPLSTGESWNVSYDIADASETLRATLVWTDYPGDAAVQLQLINNLDLVVTAPDDIYYGNGAADTLNNVEGVELTNPSSGTYTFTVTGTNIPQGPQNFSLVLYFTPGYNEYPQNNSFTNNNTIAVSSDLIWPYGINTSSITLTIDGSDVIHSLEIIDDGYRVENVTSQPYSEGQHNVSVTALTNQSQQMNYNWTFYEDYGDPVITDLINSSSSSSITLSWRQSEDTDHVEIWRDGTFIVNNSASQMTDTGLSSNTTYNYSLKPVDFAKNNGNGTNTTVTTSVRTATPSSSGGGGGGGGGGTTGEEYENIELKDVLSVFVSKGETVEFDFDKENNDIDFVRYTSLKNAGKISTTIEILKNTSTFADKPVQGKVYKYMNIWVGKTGYATESNINDPVIGFKINKKWVEDNDIDTETISMNRYSNGIWNALETKQTNSDENYIYFEASTPGFSPFAITAEESATKSSVELGTTQVNAGSPTTKENNATKYPEENESDENRKLPAISPLVTMIILVATCVLHRKQQN
jgi:PGF-pre-PGF domain-containing protein